MTASASSRRVPVRGSPRAMTLTATVSSGLIPRSFHDSFEVGFPVRVVRRELRAVLIRSGLGSKLVRREGSSIMTTRDFGESAEKSCVWERVKRHRKKRRRPGQAVGRVEKRNANMELLRCRKEGS